MAQQVVKTLLDDLDLDEGNETLAERTLTFAVDGSDYEIDVSREHEEQFLAAIRPYVKSARLAPRRGGKGVSQPPRPRSDRRRTAEIRAWARSRGLAMKDRGRIPAAIEAQFNREHDA